MNIHLQKVISEEEYTTLNLLAHQLLPEVYGKLLNQETIDFLLHSGYEITILKEKLLDDSKQDFLICIDNNIVGYLCLSLEKNSLRLDKIYIKKECRGKGVGSILMKEVLGFAVQYQCEDINLVVHSANEKAIQFYSSHGFSIQENLSREINQMVKLCGCKMILQLG